MNRNEIMEWFRNDENILEKLSKEDIYEIVNICVCSCKELHPILPELRQLIESQVNQSITDFMIRRHEMKNEC